jgi:hypothetical protein
MAVTGERRKYNLLCAKGREGTRNEAEQVVKVET